MVSAHVLVDCRGCGLQQVVPADPAARRSCARCGGALADVNVDEVPEADQTEWTFADTKTCPNCAEDVKRLARVCRYCGYRFVPDDHPYSSVDPENFEYAGFWLRVVASLIDGFIVGILSYAVGATWGAMAVDPFTTQDEMNSIVIVAQIISLASAWLYFAVMESSAKQATLGKMMIGLRVTSEDGRRISFGKATGRHIGKLISGAILGVGFLMAGWTRRKQGLHDMMASCLVLRRSS